jgi:hypothetical protein
MKLDTANTIRVGAVFLAVLIVISVSWPVYGIPLALIWLGVVIWQLIKQRNQSKS